MPASAFQDELLRLVRDELKLPWRLRDLGVAVEDLDFVAKAALRDPIVATNPRPVQSSEEVLQLLMAAW
jgi:alcohol dehydrogenase class IV